MLKPPMLAAAMALVLASPALAQDRTPAPKGAQVYFVNIEDGATLQSPATIYFGLENMGIAPAGVENNATGHHHILVNRAPFGEAEGDEGAMANGLPADDNHRHFGGGQTQVALDLPPGEHTLQLVLGDAFHVPHDPPVMSEVVTVIVE